MPSTGLLSEKKALRSFFENRKMKMYPSPVNCHGGLIRECGCLWEEIVAFD